MKRAFFCGLLCVGLLLLGGCKKEEVEEGDAGMTTAGSSDFVAMGSDMGTTNTDIGATMGSDMGTGTVMGTDIEMPPEDPSDYHGKG